MQLEGLLSLWLVLIALIAGIELLASREHRKTAARRWPANLCLSLMVAGLTSVVPISAFTAARWADARDFGLLNILGVPEALGFILSLLMLSLWGYLVHLASHKIPLLWRFHKVHHSDTDLDVTTTYRAHPLILVVLAIASAGLVVIAGLREMAVVVFAAVTLLMELWQHTALRLPARVETALGRFVITPKLHHIHHSDFAEETETNFGVDIVLWDRLFGTLLNEPKRPPEDFRYGLTQYPSERAADLHQVLRAPFTRTPNA